MNFPIRGKRRLPAALIICATLASATPMAFAEPPAPPASAIDDPTANDVAALRSALDALRDDYQQRIAELERRLAAAEASLAAVDSRPPSNLEPDPGQASEALPAAPTGLVPTSGLPSGPISVNAVAATDNNAFNPAISVTFQGQAWRSSLDQDERDIPGYPLGGESGPPPSGLATGETEIGMNANVDDLFTAQLTVPVAMEDGETHIELEEAWLETLRMPAGLAVRFGRFYSGIGYQNSRHAHAWDFADQPLPYRALLGNQYFDDGIQLRWLAPTDQYIELGAELFRGASYPAGGAADDGFGAQTLFARTGGDIGTSQSWQAGISHLRAQSEARVSGDDALPVEFTGDTDLTVAELVWKWAPDGNSLDRSLVVQGEYLRRQESGDYAWADVASDAIDQEQSGWYLQTVYQPWARWRVGARYDRLSGHDTGALFDGSPLATGRDPDRYTVMVDWSHSEFSRLRLQYAYDRSGERAASDWGLQYILSMGAHGGHSF